MGRYIKYKAGYKYRLTESCGLLTDIKPLKHINTQFIDLACDGFFTLKKYYAWNGPSGPTYDTPTGIRGSAFHDAGYQLIGMGLLEAADREVLDQLLYDLCVADGMWKWRAGLWYKAVRRFGKRHATEVNPEIIAP